MDEKSENKESGNINFSQKRRNLIKGLASLPVLGAFAYGLSSKKNYEDSLKQNISNELNINSESLIKKVRSTVKGDKIRLGIIGYGGRGNHPVRLPVCFPKMD